MKTTYINNEGIECGFIISNCGRWVDCFKETEKNIINSFFTFGRNGSGQSRPKITPIFTKKEIALQQRFAILFRGQKLVLNKCSELKLSSQDLEDFKNFEYHSTNFLDHLNTLTKDRYKTIDIYTQLLKISYANN